jgi:hypothetical protein
MSLFPFIDPPAAEEPAAAELPVAREWAWDVDKCEFKTRNGRIYIVEGKEAVKIWIWKIFQTSRYRHLIYSWDYGHELEPLVGKRYSNAVIQSEAERLVKEAIWPTLEDYVTDIRNLAVSAEKDILCTDFTAVTPYGEVEISV